jgi:hypothetical protein
MRHLMADGAGQREQEKEGMACRQGADQQRQQQRRRQVDQDVAMLAQPGGREGTAFKQATHAPHRRTAATRSQFSLWLKAEAQLATSRDLRRAQSSYNRLTLPHCEKKPCKTY